MRSHHLITAAAILGGALTALAVPAVWRASVETSRPVPAVIDAFQGETVWIEPTITSYGAAVNVSNAVLSLYWQTNGMGAAWWSKPAEAVHSVTGRIRAVWSPTNDVGASQYTYYIKASGSDGASYRAHGILRLRASPGFAPTAQPAPAYAWASPAEMQAVSNALAGAVQAEALLRVQGDDAGTNYAAGLAAALPSHAAVTGIASAVAGPLLHGHTNDLANPHVVTAEQVGALPLAGGEMASNALLTFRSADATQRSYMSAALIEVYEGDAYHGMTANGTQIGVLPGGGIDIWNYPFPASSTHTYASREWAADQIAAIPRVPTNAVQGWLMYDPGSNMWLRVSVSNWSFTVWEVTP